jgi:hypothetical protein
MHQQGLKAHRINLDGCDLLWYAALQYYVMFPDAELPQFGRGTLSWPIMCNRTSPELDK